MLLVLSFSPPNSYSLEQVGERAVTTKEQVQGVLGTGGREEEGQVALRILGEWTLAGAQLYQLPMSVL